jgi:RNA-directed DNA polymerase
MNKLLFQKYRQEFAQKALAAGRSEGYVAACLGYAEAIADRGLPVIYDAQHLSMLVGYQQPYVRAAAYGGRAFYRRYEVPKKSGGVREIVEPLPSLKEIQRWIHHSILQSVPLSKYAKGFRLGHSIRDAARFHRNQPLVVAVDIKDFFPSIGRQRVYGVFRQLGYSQPVSNVLARLCTLEGTLPQGAPTSPAISNIVCKRLDRRIGAFASKRGLRYTRYADDITVSGEFKPGDAIGFIRKVLAADGFEIHPRKIRAMERHQRQEVTGIVVNRRLKAPREVRRSLRLAVYHIKKHGLNAHLEFVGETRAHYLEHLIGLAGFVLFVDPRDTQTSHSLNYLRSLRQADK